MDNKLQVQLPALLPWQQEVWRCPARNIVLCLPRQVGKTTFAVARITAEGLNGGDSWYVAPSYKLALEFRNRLNEFVKPIPGVRYSADEETWYFPNRGTARLMSGYDPESLVGSTLTLAVLDEAAVLPEITWSKISPALKVRRGKALIVSTPYKRNWLWRCFQWGDPNSDQKLLNWQSFVFPITVNPAITEEDIEQARLEMSPNQFKREILGQFIDDGGVVFELVREQSVVPEGIQVPLPGHRYFIGVDLASAQDWTVVSVFDLTDMQQVAIHRWTQMSWREQIDYIKQVTAHWNAEIVDVEINAAGSVTYEFLSREGVPVRPFTTTNESKRDLIDSYARAIGTRKIKLLKNSVQISELEAFESETLPSGKMRYAAPRGMNDDTVIAGALSYHAATWRDTDESVAAYNVPSNFWGNAAQDRHWAFSNSKRQRYERKRTLTR